MSKAQHFLSKFILLLLKFGVLAYLFATLFPYIAEPGLESTFGTWFVRWLLIILFGAFTLGIFVMHRSQFYLYGFFLVALAAIFNLFSDLLNLVNLSQTFMHFFALTVALYFLTRDLRSETSTRRRHRIKPNEW